jgi:hypothetical protein
MKRIVAVSTLVVVTIAAQAAPVFADSTGTSGQPNQTCLSSTAPNEPGNASSASGSAFNENGGIAGSVYANPGSQGGTSSSGNSHVVAQYDVACFQVSQPHP